MKRIFLIFVSLILLIILCISIFAVSSVNNYFTVQPSDLGTSRYSLDTSYTRDTLNKYYIKIEDLTSNGSVYLEYYNGENSQSYSGTFVYTIENNLFNYDGVNQNNTYSLLLIPRVENLDISNISEIYIPVFTYNAIIYKGIGETRYSIYNTTTTTYPELQRQYYELGYNEGYNTGYSEGLENGGIALQDLPLVDKLTTFIATFTGEGTARYITPLAICMILILIYILFIRWVLSLSKSDKLVKLTDIIVLIACICILVVMYIPMINLTITQHQIVENVETTSLEETVRVVRDPITIVTDETGEIMYGPVGTVKILYESTSSDNIEDITESVLSFIETTGG